MVQLVVNPDQVGQHCFHVGLVFVRMKEQYLFNGKVQDLLHHVTVISRLKINQQESPSGGF